MGLDGRSKTMKKVRVSRGRRVGWNAPFGPLAVFNSLSGHVAINTGVRQRVEITGNDQGKVGAGKGGNQLRCHQFCFDLFDPIH